MKFICLTIHTERLHSDKLWQEIQKIIRVFNKLQVRATWFSVNPSFVGYGFNQEKWIERLNFLKENRQKIAQHTHFYKGKEGVRKGLGYDLGKENVEKRLLEDRTWLKEKIGIFPQGFVSGSWRINEEILKTLKEKGYSYDLSLRNGVLQIRDNFIEIPTLFNIRDLIKSFLLLRLNKKCIKWKDFSIWTIYFHDYDLERFFFRNSLIFLIYFLSYLNFKFIGIRELYEKITRE